MLAEYICDFIVVNESHIIRKNLCESVRKDKHKKFGKNLKFHRKGNMSISLVIIHRKSQGIYQTTTKTKKTKTPLKLTISEFSKRQDTLMWPTHEISLASVH